MEAAGAVAENELEHGLAAAAPAFDALRDDPAARRGGFAQPQFGNGTEMPAVFVAARRVQQQIADGVNSEPRELGGAFGADAPQRCQRRVERIGGRRIWHKRIYRGTRPAWKRQNTGTATFNFEL